MILWPFGGTACSTTSRPPWRSRPRCDFLCTGEPGTASSADADERGDDQAEQEEIVAALAHGVDQLRLGVSPVGSPRPRLDSASRAGRRRRSRVSTSRASVPGESSTVTSSSAIAEHRREETARGQHLVADRESSIIACCACWRRRCGRDDATARRRNRMRTIRMKKPPFTGPLRSPLPAFPR